VFIKLEDEIEKISRNVDKIPTKLGRVITQKSHQVIRYTNIYTSPECHDHFLNRGTTKQYLPLQGTVPYTRNKRMQERKVEGYFNPL
jgi:hypothetical protein